MRRSETAQEVRMMRFEEVNERFEAKRIGCDLAADLLGMSVSTFYRIRRRFEEDGLEGLADRRLGRLSARSAPVDEVAKVLGLFKTKYSDFTVKHFHEKLSGEGIKRGYTWTKNILQTAGLVQKAPRRGAHRRKRARKPLPGMMLHQDGSRHQWIPGLWWDLIVTMDDATSEIYSMLFVDEEGTMSTFLALQEVIQAHGLFGSLYTDRGSHYWNTPEAGGQVDKTRPTQVGRALAQLGIEMIAAYSPQARGRSERMFGTLQGRLPQELRLQGITTLTEANSFLREVYLPAHNAKFRTPAEEEGTAFIPWVGRNLADILCIQEERTVGNDNTVRYNKKALQIPADQHRYHYVKAQVRVHEYPDGGLSVFHGPRKLCRYTASGEQMQEEIKNKTAKQAA